MHKKYLIRTKLLEKENLDFTKNLSNIKTMLQKNSSGQIYLDTYGNETESTQALDTPRMKGKEINFQHPLVPKNINSLNHDLSKSNKNYYSNGTDSLKNYEIYNLESRLSKFNDLKNMINKIDICDNNKDKKVFFSTNRGINMKNYYSYKINVDITEEISEPINNSNNLNKKDLSDFNSHRKNINKANFKDNNATLNSNKEKNQKANEKSVKIILDRENDRTLTVINEKDSSSEKIIETKDRFFKYNKDKTKSQKELSIEDKNIIKERKMAILKKSFEKFCHNLCIRENRVFHINKVLVGLFHKEAKCLKIEALKDKGQNSKLANEGTLPSQEVFNQEMDNENLEQNRNILFDFF